MHALPEPVRTDSLARQVFGILKEAVFAGKLQPGELLRELRLSRALKVSQATIREALALLEQVGLVVRTHNRKTEVTKLSREEVRDRLAMRLLLEELAAVRAARRMTEEDFEQLSRYAAEIAAGIAAHDYLACALSDMQFHRFIWERSGSPVLCKTLDQLTTPLFAFLGVLHKAGMVDLRTMKPHEAIVDALRSRNESRVRKELRRHIEGSYSEFVGSGAPSLDALVAAGDHLALHLSQRAT